jgi:SNF2 family DNA or RNA helicase
MSALLKSSHEFSILDEVNKHFKLPFQPFEFQRAAIEELGLFERSGWYAEPGCGKTLMSTVVALNKQLDNPKLVTFVIMPPILINSWARWLASVGGVDRVVVYRGTPKERNALKIKNARFILMSVQIFKRDIHRFEREFATRPRLGVVDEATSIKNTDSDNHRTVRDFFNGHGLLLLTGTPLSNPMDVYGYVKLIAPSVYRSLQQFKNIHVEEQDFFGTVTKWRNFDLLQTNLLTNSCRMLKEHVLKDLKQPVYTPIHYPLDEAHRRLYERLMAEQLLEYKSGKIIDATSAIRLHHAAQQIVCNFDHFADDPSKRSAAFDILDAVVEELGLASGSGKKLLVFSLYRMTNRKLVQYLSPYGAVACYSEVSPAQQARNIDRFLADPKCQILIAQPLSAGYGLNLQEVCSDVLFLETPVVPAHFHQSVARVYREGQRNTPVVRIGIAEGTIQTYLHRRLLEKDALVNRIQIGFEDLRDAIYGDD